MGLINITSDRKNVTLDSDMILYIIMHGKIAEIHIVGGSVYETRVALKDLEGLLKEEFVKIHRGCIVSVKAVHDVTNTVNLSDGEELLYTVRKKKQIVSELQEKQKKMIYALGKKGIPVTEEEYRCHYQKDTQDADADVTWTTKRAGLLSVVQKNTENVAALIEQEGDETCLTRLMDAVTVTSEYKYFNIIEP